MGNDGNNAQGFDGIDRERAERDIDLLIGTVVSLFVDMWDDASGFFGVLQSKWGSPNALLYTKDEVPKYQEIFTRFITEGCKVAKGAFDAANALLRANGEEELTKDPGSVESHLNILARQDLPVCGDSVNGIVGMDKEGVRIVLDAYKRSVSKILGRIDEMPEGIAFYDSEGNLVEVYKSNLRSFKGEIQSLLNETTTSMNGYIETEIDNILLAKREAQEAMQA